MKNSSNSIGIIGMGWVGSSIAISTLHAGICSELRVNDLNRDIAEGEAMDLSHGSSFYATAKVIPSSIEDMKDCKAIIITAGRGGKPNESRLQLLTDNALIAQSIAEKLKNYDGFIIVVSNPVDVLTYFYQKYTGLPSNQVIGTGTMLDTARLRELIGRTIHVDPKSIHANVIGEHGDSEVTVWSRAMAGGIPLRNWDLWNETYEKDISEQVRTAAYEIIKRKGATNHAIGLVTAHLLKWILRGEQRIVNVSTLMDGPYGLEKVALSLPSVIDKSGVREVKELNLNDEELARFLHSAEVLREAIQQIENKL